MIFYKVTERYKDVKDKRHLMALFYRSYTNHITFLANRRTTLGEILACDMSEDGDHDTLWAIIGPAEFLSVDHLIGAAPEPVRSCLKAMHETEPRKLRRPYRKRLTGRETLNERLCRFAGVDPKLFDMPALLRQYLSSAI